jgi:hypothetical protein
MILAGDYFYLRRGNKYVKKIYVGPYNGERVVVKDPESGHKTVEYWVMMGDKCEADSPLEIQYADS